MTVVADAAVAPEHGAPQEGHGGLLDWLTTTDHKKIRLLPLASRRFARASPRGNWDPATLARQRAEAPMVPR